MSRALVLAGSAVALAASPAAAQSMSGMNMPGMDMLKPVPKQATAKKKTAAAKKAPSRSPTADPSSDTMVGMGTSDRPAPTGMPMTDMAQPMQMHDTPTGTDLPAGDAPPPAPPTDRYADRTFGAAAMQPARAAFLHENGGETFSQVMFNLAEIQIRNGRDGYRWDGEGWFGGDLNRFVAKSEGDGTFGKGVEAAEAQALYSRAIGPYFNLQTGIRHDFQPAPTETYATIGIEGLAPYDFETEAALFVSTKGDVLGRAEGWYDEQITQRFVLQPRVELNFAAQDVPEDRIGAGLSTAELGLRLRYEISRRFAPYVGLSYETKIGRTADYARADGEPPHMTCLVFGVRTWF
ncbi:copper resistance protein B [Sphingomonas koreensis]|nr:copper resistance protein B [Sphingomonas koreensis]